MRAKNREINIFNMSLLDILTGALGAFMFMMLSFVPYYNIVMEQKLEPNPDETVIDKDKLEELKKQKNRVAELEKKIADLENEKKQLQEKIDELLEKLKKCGKGDVTAEELAKLEEENNRLRKEIEALKKKIEELEAKVRLLEEENVKLRSRNLALESENKELKALIEKLKAEIAELRKLLEKMSTSDPRFEAMYRIVQAELSARDKRLIMAVEVEDVVGTYELVVQDPKGMWYARKSFFPLGRKAVRVISRTGSELIEDRSRGFRKPERNLLYLEMDGFVMFGEYKIGIRRVDPKPAEAVATAVPSATPTPVVLPPWNVQSIKGAENTPRIGELSLIFGFHPTFLTLQFMRFHGSAGIIVRPSGGNPIPPPPPPPKSGFPLSFLWEASTANAQSVEGAVRQEIQRKNETLPAVKIRGFVDVQFRRRSHNVEVIPEQYIFSDGSISMLARVTISAGTTLSPVVLDWYSPLKADRWPSEWSETHITRELRVREEDEANARRFNPMVSDEFCGAVPGGCQQPRRGDITAQEIDPDYEKLDEDRKLAESLPSPTPTSAAGGSSPVQLMNGLVGAKPDGSQKLPAAGAGGERRGGLSHRAEDLDQDAQKAMNERAKNPLVMPPSVGPSEYERRIEERKKLRQRNETE